MTRRLLLGVLVALAACASSQSLLRDTRFAPETEVALGEMTWDERGFFRRDLVVGEGEEPNSRSAVSIDYLVRLADGTVVDRSAPGAPMVLRRGEGAAIRGLEFGLDGMRVGGVRQLVLPPALGYGTEGNASVPPSAVLVMIIRLDSVR